MSDLVKFIIGLFVVYMLFTNFDKAVKIGNAIVDKAYELVVDDNEEEE